MVILGLGSNLGDRLNFIKEAIKQLSDIISDIKTSYVYESNALLLENAPESWDIPFLNMAISGKTNLSPRDLLKKIKKIEKKVGRKNNTERWSPREIDIDILAFNTDIIEYADLVIPHKDLLERDFFLQPFADIAPKWKYPVEGHNFGKTMDSVLKNKAKPLNTIKTDFSI